MEGAKTADGKRFVGVGTRGVDSVVDVGVDGLAPADGAEAGLGCAGLEGTP